MSKHLNEHGGAITVIKAPWRSGGRRTTQSPSPAAAFLLPIDLNRFIFFLSFFPSCFGAYLNRRWFSFKPSRPVSLSLAESKTLLLSLAIFFSAHGGRSKKKEKNLGSCFWQPGLVIKQRSVFMVVSL